MYQVLLFKFRRHLCKGSIVLPWPLFFVIQTILDNGTRDVIGASHLQSGRRDNYSKYKNDSGTKGSNSTFNLSNIFARTRLV